MTTQFSPDSLRRAAATALWAVRNSDPDHEEGVGGNCVEALTAEFLRDMRADAPAYLENIAGGAAKSWMTRVAGQNISRDELMDRFDAYLPTYETELRLLSELRSLTCTTPVSTRILLQAVLPGAFAIWDGKPPRTAPASHPDAPLARILEQVAEDVVPLRDKAELMARIFDAMHLSRKGCGRTARFPTGYVLSAARAAHEDMEHRVTTVLHEYGLPRTAAEPRTRARP